MSDADVMTGSEAIAAAFVTAHREAWALADYPGEIPATLDATYRIQDATILLVDDAGVRNGQASSFPGGSGQSVAFLLENLAARGHSVVPGTWVSTGAVSGVHEIAPGSTAVAQFGDFGRIECHIVAALAETASSHAGTL